MKADITVSQTGNGRVALDGTDISSAVRGFRLDAFVGETTRLTLDVVPRGTDVEADAEVVIDGAMAAVLERLGWTPPGGKS